MKQKQTMNVQSSISEQITQQLTAVEVPTVWTKLWK